MVAKFPHIQLPWGSELQYLFTLTYQHHTQYRVPSI